MTRTEYIGVITPKKDFFESWVRGHKDFNHSSSVDYRYVWINDTRSLAGRTFDAIVESNKSDEIPDVVKAAQYHLRKETKT